MTAEDITKLGGKKLIAGLWSIPTPPLANSSFSEYIALLSPKEGVCKVIAIAPLITNDAYGVVIKNRFSDLSAALKDKYGKPTSESDYLRTGSIWSDPRYWMTALSKKERVLATYWLTPGVTLPAPLSAIGLTTSAESSSTGKLQLAYEFDNFKACQTELKGSPGTGL